MRDWDKFYRENPGIYEKSNNISFQVMEAMKYTRSGRALDLGCGEGKNSMFLAERGFQVTALDISSVALERLRKLASEKNLQVTCITDSLDNFRFLDSYDFIMCNFLLHFFRKDIGLDLIKRIQNHTSMQGINVLSCFRDELPFFDKNVREHCYFEHDELRHIYDGWAVKWYSEPIGPMAKKDAGGKPLQQKMAIIVAQKA